MDAETWEKGFDGLQSINDAAVIPARQRRRDRGRRGGDEDSELDEDAGRG